MPADTQLVVQPSTNTELSTVLTSLHDQLMRAAANAINAQSAGQGYTALEIRAMTKVEALRLLNGFDLATILERGRIVHEIDQEGLVGVFPGDYQSLEQIAADIGISASELSDTKALCDTVFPWIEANTGNTVAYWWDRIGKSKFREMVPVLRALITGETTTERGSVAQSIEALLDQAQTNATASGEGDSLPTQVLRGRAALSVLEFGSLPVREMRQQIRPIRTPNIPGIKIRSENERMYVVLRLTAEQDTMLSRLLGTHADVTPIEAPQVPTITAELDRLRL